MKKDTDVKATVWKQNKTYSQHDIPKIEAG